MRSSSPSMSQWLDNHPNYDGELKILGIILPSQRFGRLALKSNKQKQTKHNSDDQSVEHDNVQQLLSKLLEEMQDDETEARVHGDNLSDLQSLIEASEENDTVTSSEAETQLLDLVVMEKRRRIRAKRKEARQEGDEIRIFVLKCIAEKGEVSWMDIAATTEEYSAKDIKRAVRALRRQGLIKRVDGGGRGVKAIFDVVTK